MFTQIVDFAATDKLQNVTINITNDAVAEKTEYFTITVEAISKEVVIFPYATTTVEILDDDSKLKINIIDDTFHFFIK